MLLSLLPMFVITYYVIVVYALLACIPWLNIGIWIAIIIFSLHYLSFFSTLLFPGLIHRLFLCSIVCAFPCAICLCRSLFSGKYRTKHRLSTAGNTLLVPHIASGPWFVIQIILFCLVSLCGCVILCILGISEVLGSEAFVWLICHIILAIIAPFCLCFVKWFFKPFNRYRFTTCFLGKFGSDITVSSRCQTSAPD